MSLANLGLVPIPSRGTPNRVRAKEDDDLVSRLRSMPPVPEGEKPNVVEDVTRLLQGDSSSPKVRNAAAILLTDLIGREAASSIVSVLRRPGIGKSSGSLLFALNEVDASIPLDLAVQLIETGSLEAQGEALTFLEHGRIIPFAADDFDQALARLEALKGSQDANIANAVGIALDYMHDLAPDASPGPAS